MLNPTIPIWFIHLLGEKRFVIFVGIWHHCLASNVPLFQHDCINHCLTTDNNWLRHICAENGLLITFYTWITNITLFLFSIIWYNHNKRWTIYTKNVISAGKDISMRVKEKSKLNIIHTKEIKSTSSIPAASHATSFWHDSQLWRHFVTQNTQV